MLKEFELYASSEELTLDNGATTEVYFVTSQGLVEQIEKKLSDTEIEKLSMVTPLYFYQSVTGLSEIEILALLCKVLDRSRFEIDYLNEETKQGIVITFKDKNAAAQLIKVIYDNLNKEYNKSTIDDDN